MDEREKPPVVIVGAGVAGLTCAIDLHAAGLDVLILDQNETAGGRIRTQRRPDGYLIDLGFQVILDAYPALRRHVNLAVIEPQAFDAGALIWSGKRRIPLLDPLRHPSSLLRDLTAPVLTAGDRWRLIRLALRTWNARWATAADAATGESALDTLRASGFSDRFIERFAWPFWGGILLDRSLATSDGPLLFTFKMFLQGRAVLPAAGVQAVPDHLASQLPPGAIRYRQRVEELVRSDGGITGVRVGGQVIPASAVVIATDPPALHRLTGDEPPERAGVGCTTVYLAGERDPGIGKRLVLDGTGKLTINHLAPLSTVAPSYAPSERHLLAAVVLTGSPGAELDETALMRRVREETALILGHAVNDWTPLTAVRIPFSLSAQPPDIYEHLPESRTATPGLYLAGEAIADSSLNGAIASGERAASAVLNDQHSPSRI